MANHVVIPTLAYNFVLVVTHILFITCLQANCLLLFRTIFVNPRWRTFNHTSRIIISGTIYSIVFIPIPNRTYKLYRRQSITW